MKLAVVIPFYQRQPGLLGTAVASIAAQRLRDDVTITVIIVDDGSPVSAASEALPDLPGAGGVRIIARSNGGVASARNAGLDAVAADTDYVAFLDSDDRWLPDHLQNGVDLLRQGASFYFDNGYDTQGRDRFTRTPFIRDHMGYAPEQPPCGRVFEGRRLFAALVTECVPHTSQVIYDFQALGHHRFDESLRIAGEDHLFWLTLTRSAALVGYHTGLMGARGFGISINRDAFGWDKPESLERLVDEIGLYTKIRRNFASTADQRAAIDAKLAQDHDHFVFLALRNCTRNPGAVARAVGRASRIDAALWRRAPASLLRLRTHRASFRTV
ncbi:glycosyltransferase family 2 protein [Polymorphobacter fuscus]|uniref:glycosyltransferase family 2 protein n=1 Tax=Sandarakinorhabdus fusca TaxID=1439888 RepID=UPI00142F5BA1|nr:glycosyltransferase family 2 protein [Polymorphobacter fuscus]NJC08774.1 succinoglycan biosynthesis protein ExoW [Polymorphobacter fuscus]